MIIRTQENFVEKPVKLRRIYGSYREGILISQQDRGRVDTVSGYVYRIQTREYLSLGPWVLFKALLISIFYGQERLE